MRTTQWPAISAELAASAEGVPVVVSVPEDLIVYPDSSSRTPFCG